MHLQVSLPCSSDETPYCPVLTVTKVFKWKYLFLLEGVLWTCCSTAACGRVKSGWTDFRQFFEIKPSEFFPHSILSCTTVSYTLKKHMVINKIWFVLLLGICCLWLFICLYLNWLFRDRTCICSVSYEVFLEGTDMNVIHMHKSQHHITSLCIYTSAVACAKCTTSQIHLRKQRCVQFVTAVTLKTEGH